MSSEHRDNVVFENPMYDTSSGSPLPGTQGRRPPPPVPLPGEDSDALEGYGVSRQIEAVYYDIAAETVGYDTVNDSPSGLSAIKLVNTPPTRITAQSAYHRASAAQAAPITVQSAYHHASSAQLPRLPMTAGDHSSRDQCTPWLPATASQPLRPQWWCSVHTSKRVPHR